MQPCENKIIVQVFIWSNILLPAKFADWKEQITHDIALVKLVSLSASANLVKTPKPFGSCEGFATNIRPVLNIYIC